MSAQKSFESAVCAIYIQQKRPDSRGNLTNIIMKSMIYDNGIII